MPQYLFKKLGCLCVLTKSIQRAKIFVSEANKGPLKFKCLKLKELWPNKPRELLKSAGQSDPP